MNAPYIFKSEVHMRLLYTRRKHTCRGKRATEVSGRSGCNCFVEAELGDSLVLFPDPTHKWERGPVTFK